MIIIVVGHFIPDSVVRNKGLYTAWARFLMDLFFSMKK